jgi:hypothetical protein
MARAHSIWVVVDGGVPVAAFTVKHELVTWLNRYGPDARSYFKLYKIRDGIGWPDSQSMIRVELNEVI